jgi:cytidylate kinase
MHEITGIEFDRIEKMGCCSHSANTGAQNKAEGVAQISHYIYIKDIAASRGMSFYDLVDLVVEDLKAQARIDAVVKEIERREEKAVCGLTLTDYHEIIALLKEGVGK